MTFPKTLDRQLACKQGYLQEHFTPALLFNDFSLFNSCLLINLSTRYPVIKSSHGTQNLSAHSLVQ